MPSPEPPGPSGMYRHSAAWFDLRYAQKDYGVEAARLTALVERVHPNAQTLLDVACGTGRHLSHLGARFRVEGLDLNPDLLQQARRRLDDVPLHQADMTDFDLGRTFDVVTCLFASLPYLGSVDAMRRAVSCMARHLAPGGVLIVEPGLTPDVYRENEVVHNVRRTPDGALSWMYVMRRRESLAVWDIHWLVGTPVDGIRHVVEQEVFSLFTTAECVSALAGAGLDALHLAHGLHGYGVLIGRRQPWTDDERAAAARVIAG